MAQDPCDVAIVIPLKEEFDVLHSRIANDWTPEEDADTQTYDYLFSRQCKSGGHYRCVVTFVGDMGELSAGQETQRLLGKWKPITVVVMGIAAGISNDVRVGDVVIGTVVDSYLQNSKAIDAGDGYEFEFSGEPYRPSRSLINKTRNYQYVEQSAFKAWQENARNTLDHSLIDSQLDDLAANGLVRHSPAVEWGHIATGPVVAAAKAFIDKVKKRDRKYVALEMESGGVLAAIYSKCDPAISMVIRGISDFGDDRKAKLDAVGEGCLRRYAMGNAIEYLWNLMDAGFLKRSTPQNP